MFILKTAATILMGIALFLFAVRCKKRSDKEDSDNSANQQNKGRNYNMFNDVTDEIYYDDDEGIDYYD